jgi:FKBP-type peptidyl-prolyl cis-trans isomerase
MKYPTLRHLSLVLAALVHYHCQKEVVYAPIGHQQEALADSQMRTKNLNNAQRKAIEKWIGEQKQPFYPTGLGYFASVEHLSQQPARKIDTPVSYQYWLKDFKQKNYYPKPIVGLNQMIGSINDLQAVTDAVAHLQDGQKVRLLVPSSLAYGSVGDEKQIRTDAPLIIDIEIIKP